MLVLLRNIKQKIKMESVNGPPVAFASPEITAQVAENQAQREAVLHQLLGVDYEQARDEGLIDQFYYDPRTGEDGLMHVLGGDVTKHEEAELPGGFHHEPSASVVWPVEEGKPARTYVNREHVADLIARRASETDPKTKKRLQTRISDFREFPFEPYHGRVVIDDKKKLTLRHDEATGEKTKVIEPNNGMFPKEYDPFTVLKAIKTAHDSRDSAGDEIIIDNGLVVGEGTAPMLNSENKMRIRLLLDPETDKIISAFPIVRPGAMKLSKEAVRQYLGLS